MNIEELSSALNPEIYERFKTAIELGKWPNGDILSKEQKQICIQAIIAYEHKHVKHEERTGYLPSKNVGKNKPEQENPLKWK